MSGFQKATRKRSKARIAISGPSGAGKTYTALAIASGLGEKIALIDTESGSASLYADTFDFDVLEIAPPYSPKKYIDAIASAKGYDVLVIDSLSHAWASEGGVLDIVDKEKARIKDNQWAAWRVGTPQHNSLVNAVLQAPMHVIATVRSKMAYEMEKDEKGKTSIRKLGLTPIQREGLEYEFAIFGEMDISHNLTVSKSRMASLQDLVVEKPGPELGKKIREWFESAPEAVEAPAEPAPAPAQAPIPADAPPASPAGTSNGNGHAKPGDHSAFWHEFGEKYGFKQAIMLKRVRDMPKGDLVRDLAHLNPDSVLGKELQKSIAEAGTAW